MKDSTEHVKQAIEQAEVAAATVKDPELRRAAFETVLGWLLGGGHPPPSVLVHHDGKAKPPKTAAKQQPAPKKPKGGPQAKVEEFIEQGYFEAPKTLGEILNELATAAGLHLDRKQLAVVMLRLTRKQKLRRKTGPTEEEPYVYSKWA